MTVQTRETVLRRKLAPPAPDPKASDPAPSGAAQGVGRAFARALSNATPLVADGGVTRRSIVSQSELFDSIESDAFVGLLAAGSAGPALAVLDQSGFSAVIEAMTIGCLGPRAPVTRRATPTDASLLADLIDKTLADLNDPAALECRFQSVVPDHRLLAVLLDDVPFDLVVHDLTVLSGDEKRTAQVMLAFPHVVAPVTDVGHEADTGEPEANVWQTALEESVLLAPASLRAELGRVTMPLSEVLELGVGGALTLPLSNLEELQLVALDGTVQAVGRLGQSRGMRAVRLTSWPNGIPPEPKMTEMPAPGYGKLEAEGDGTEQSD